MLAYLSLVLSLLTLALAAGLLVLLRRASRARRELAESQHDRALALDERCDGLREQLQTLTLRHRADHLLDLVHLCERQGRLDGERARRLERYAYDLREEARRSAGAD